MLLPERTLCLNRNDITLRHQAAPCCLLWHPGSLAPPTVFVLCVLCRVSSRWGGRARESETETERGTGYTYKMYQVRHPWMNVSACEWMWLCLTQVRLRVLSGTVILKEYVLLSFLPSYPVIPLKCPLISSLHRTHHTDTQMCMLWAQTGEEEDGYFIVIIVVIIFASPEPTVC